MADSAKREKIAAARKKLKQFQQKSSKKPDKEDARPVNGQNSEVNTRGSSSSSQHSTSQHPPPNATSATVQHLASHNALHSDTANATRTTPGAMRSTNASSSNVSDNFNHHTPNSDSAVDSIDSSTNPSHRLNPGLSASTERLQQLSKQINGLISQSDDNSTIDLESRNQELATLLKKHTHTNEQLNLQLQDLKTKNSRLQSEFDAKRKAVEDEHRKELSQIKEQLKVHIQTIGILVAEKTELQSNLNQSTKLVTEQHENIDELKGRLKASRQRVSDLEKNYTNASSASQKNEQTVQDYSKNIEQLKLKVYKLTKANDDSRQQISELQEKLEGKVKECYKSEDAVIDLKGQLELAQLQLTQMQNSVEKPAISEDVEELVQQKTALEAKLHQYEDSFHKVSSERDKLSEQYNNYVTQLNTQTQQMKSQLEKLEKEKEELDRQYSSLAEENALLKQRQESVSVDTVALRAEKSRLTTELEQARTEVETMQRDLQSHVLNNSSLSQMVHEKEDRISDLELSLKRISDNVVDREKILDDMQSDKTALSRAMAQNKELKNQLTELQSGFVSLTNDKMELMSKLQSEEHISKELATRLEQQEDEIKDVRHQLAEKSIQLSELETSTHEMHKEHYTALNIEDRLRHFEAQSKLVDTLQKELNSAQDTINALTNQNSTLQATLNETTSGGGEGYGGGVGDGRDELVNALNSSIHQLEMERNQVLENLSQEKAVRQEIEAKLQDMQQELAHQTPAVLNGDLINKAQFDALQYAMKQLENKYTTSMRDKADLADKNEQLEYLIVQLQGETETIGEYISLYRQQRTMLREKQHQKDDYISTLAKDREYMQDKLGQLQALVMQLLGERNMLHTYDMQVQQATGGAARRANVSRLADGQTSLEKGEDWPDYESDDSGESVVEAIVGGSPEHAHTDGFTEHSTDPLLLHHPGAPNQQLLTSTPNRTMSPAGPSSPGGSTVSPENPTAQQIMSLLHELGHSNIVEESSELERSVFRCNNCIGKPHIV